MSEEAEFWRCSTMDAALRSDERFSKVRHVRYWPKADMPIALRNGRFRPKADIGSQQSGSTQTALGSLWRAISPHDLSLRGGNEAARVHHTSRRRGCFLAAHGACAAS
jgi:hypothetical protein